MPTGSGNPNPAAAPGVRSARLPQPQVHPLPDFMRNPAASADVLVDADDPSLMYVPLPLLPHWVQAGIGGGVVGIVFAKHIIERDDQEPRLLLHAWPQTLAPSSRPPRPASGAAEFAFFPYTVETDEQAETITKAFSDSRPLEDFIAEGAGALKQVRERVWRFVCERSDGTRADRANASRRKDPTADLLDWADSVGGRLGSYWTKLAATRKVGKDIREEVPTCYQVRLRTVLGTTLWKDSAFARDHRHAAAAVAEELALADALRYHVDRVVVQAPEGGPWYSFLVEELYSDGERLDALAELSVEERNQRSAAQRGRTLLDERDAASLREDDRHWWARFSGWLSGFVPRLSEESSGQIHARIHR